MMSNVRRPVCRRKSGIQLGVKTARKVASQDIQRHCTLSRRREPAGVLPSPLGREAYPHPA